MWLSKAEHDLLNIENNLKAPEIPWDTLSDHPNPAMHDHLASGHIREGFRGSERATE